MIFRSCSREKEISDLLDRGHWPHAVTPELQAHMKGCGTCSDFVLASVAFRNARAGLVSTDRFNAPGVLWWRAQLRRRNAAVDRVGRPIFGAQIFALAINLLIAVGFVASRQRQGVHWLAWLSDLSQSRTFRLERLLPFASANSDWSPMLLIVSFGALALLGGVVLYLATGSNEKQP
jgi:hypothetical protein